MKPKKLTSHSVTIAGVKVPIKVGKSKTNLGECHYEPVPHIKLMSHTTNNPNNEEIGSTALHEILRMVVHINGLEGHFEFGYDSEEKLVRAIERTLWPLIKSNYFDRYLTQ